ncbi:hypothetical protein H9L13_06720 [Sphingomonas lutea]|uniref:Uncharacterized protein n=1 Tax=Sphingomonas lutea TaxID=1045317 RepID=A0A7G9SF00_9SPHN|nr:hypothetical protein [Sphingomonas lutea]QNN66425.1 hypothetical protein H9L13_06720 [Sphingomonas lutea]
MKIILGAIALTLSVPAFAQAAPAADPHAGHAMPAGTDHSQHQQGKHDCKACCETMKGKDGKMACMDKAEAKPASADAAAHQGHAGH